jgi:hypothetical protein
VKENIEDYDLLTAVMICLGDPDGDNYSGILKLLDVLLSSDKKPEEKKKILEDDFDIEMTKSLEREVSLMCNLSKGVEERGISKGITQGILYSIQNLMATTSWTADEAMAALKIPEEERSKYVDAMNQK